MPETKKKLTRDEIKVYVDEWAGLASRIERAEKARTKAMSPVIERHAEELAAVTGEHDTKLENLRAQAAAIEGQVIPWLTEKKTPVRIAGEKGEAVLTIGTRYGARSVTVADFLEAAKGEKKEAAYGCLKVMVEKAEKMLGKDKFDKIAPKAAAVVKTAVLARL